VTFIKICGITNIDDAIASVKLGANLLGFVFADSPRQVETQTVKNIQRVLAGDVKTVGVFTEESDDVLKIMDECALTYAQLHGSQSEKFAQKLGADRVIRAVRILDQSSLDLLSVYSECSYYLLDTYKKGRPGGTGETFDWELAIEAKSFGKLLFLSGGLGPSNINEAVRRVQPFGVDASSGLESSPGIKDHKKIKEFIKHVREADCNT